MNHQINEKLLTHLKEVLKQKSKFPVGIVANFGPDNQTITKIVAMIVPGYDLKPRHKTWIKPETSSDSEIANQIGQFFLDFNTTDIVIAEGVIGCPHDEGVDFPVGEDCPYCPYWAKTTK